MKTFRNPDVDLMAICVDSDELDIFESKALTELIWFKWNSYCQKFHMIGCFFHFLYIFGIVLQINAVYINYDVDNKERYALIATLGLVYPHAYDSIQLYNEGFAGYFNSFWNYTDMAFIWLGLANEINQYLNDPFTLTSKLLMIIIILLSIIKTFFFLRIFSSLSYIVTMLKNVMYDLRVFFIFYMSLIFLFSLIFGVLGIGNYKVPSDFTEFLAELPDDFESMRGGQTPN